MIIGLIVPIRLPMKPLGSWMGSYQKRWKYPLRIITFRMIVIEMG